MGRIYYTVYLKVSDEVVCSGTAEECARSMGKTLNGFHSMVSKNQLHRQNKYEIYKEKIYPEDED